MTTLPVSESSFEDIIYLLIGVAWIAWSIYKGTQKGKKGKVKQTGRPAPVQKGKSFFETLISEITEEKSKVPYDQPVEETEVQAVEELQPEPKKEEVVFSYDDVYEESNLETEKGVYKNITTDREKTKKKTSTFSKHIKKKRRIDLRKAVVYAEILNRRY